MFFTGQSLIIRVPGENDIYGNNVTLRKNTLDGGGGRKSYIDYNFVLPDSRVLAFYIYSLGTGTSVEGVFFRLQIWRPLDITILKFQLVWQQRIQVTNTTDGLYTVSTC